MVVRLPSADGNAEQPRTSAQAHRAAERQDDRGRVLRPGRPPGGAPPRRSSRQRERARPAPLRRLRAPTWSTPSRGKRPTSPTGGLAPLPELRALRAGRLRPGRVRPLRRSARAGTDALTRDFKRLMAANMAEEIDRFVAGARRRRDPADGLLGASPLGVALDHAVGDQVQQSRLLAAGSSSAARPPSPPPRAPARTRGPPPARPWPRSGRRRASASAARRDLAPQVERRQRRVALARQDQRQRDRAVEQVGAARLAGALDRARHVEHVVEDLERDADPAAELRRARRRRAAPGAPSSAPSRQAASNRRAVFSSQRSR